MKENARAQFNYMVRAALSDYAHSDAAPEGAEFWDCQQLPNVARTVMLRDDDGEDFYITPAFDGVFHFMTEDSTLDVPFWIGYNARHSRLIICCGPDPDAPTITEPLPPVPE